MFTSLYQIHYFTNHKPMNSRILNRIEIINEMALLFSSYFMFIFTDWILDIEFRYYLGFFFMYFLIMTLAINFIIIGFEMAQGLGAAFMRNPLIQKCVSKIEKFNEEYFKPEPPEPTLIPQKKVRVSKKKRL